MYWSKVLTPPTTFLARPLEYRTPVPGGEALDLHFSGFEDVDVAHLKRFVVALGGKVSDFFERKRTHLVLADGKSFDDIKPRKAREWGKPIWARAQLEHFGRERAHEREEMEGEHPAMEVDEAEEVVPATAPSGPLTGCTCLLSRKLEVSSPADWCMLACALVSLTFLSCTGV